MKIRVDFLIHIERNKSTYADESVLLQIQCDVIMNRDRHLCTWGLNYMNPEQTLLNPDLPVPLYHQLKNVMLEKIQKGQWSAGFCIPTETELMNMYGISRTTVRQAVTALEQAGYLSKKQGQGTFVKSGRLVERLGRLTGFAEEMLQQGYVPSAQLISFEEVKDVDRMNDRGLFHIPQLPKDTSWININRIRLADGEPIAVERSFWPKDIADLLQQEDLSSVAFYTVLERNGIYLQEADENIASINAGREDAKHLKIQVGSALIQIERSTMDTNRRLIEHTYTRYRGDRYIYHVKLRR